MFKYFVLLNQGILNFSIDFLRERQIKRNIDLLPPTLTSGTEPKTWVWALTGN